MNRTNRGYPQPDTEAEYEQAIAECVQFAHEMHRKRHALRRVSAVPEDDRCAIATLVALLGATGPMRGKAWCIAEECVPIFQLHRGLMDAVCEMFPVTGKYEP